MSLQTGAKRYRWDRVHVEVPEELKSSGPARSTAAVVVAAGGSTLLFWWVGRSITWSVDLQVAFLVTCFGLILAIAVAYSWVIDRVWRRTNEAASSALAAFKGDFVAGVSHELRNALTGIVGYAQLVDARLLGGDNAEAINSVVSQSVELSRVVEDLVARARLDSGILALETRPVPVLDQVRPAVGLLEVMGAEVTVECEAADVVVDPEAMRHVLYNLLVNAHRHGLPPVSVRGRAFGDRYVCQVVDGGPGVPPGEEEEMFLSNRTRVDDARPGAVGLGLAVAKDLADRMHSDLSYRHIRGETHFILTMPLAPVQERKHAVLLPTRAVASPLRRARRRELEGIEGVH